MSEDRQGFYDTEGGMEPRRRAKEGDSQGSQAPSDHFGRTAPWAGHTD